MSTVTNPVAASETNDAPTYVVPQEPWLRLFLRFLRLIDRQTPPRIALHLIVDNYGTHKQQLKTLKEWAGI